MRHGRAKLRLSRESERRATKERPSARSGRRLGWSLALPRLIPTTPHFPLAPKAVSIAMNTLPCRAPLALWTWM